MGLEVLPNPHVHIQEDNCNHSGYVQYGKSRNAKFTSCRWDFLLLLKLKDHCVAAMAAVICYVYAA